MGLFSFLFGSKGGFGRRSVSADTKRRIEADWRKISSLMKSGGPSQIREALLTADKTVDAALKDLVEGETMGERLKNASHLFDRDVYDKIWKAHKLRNSLVHEAGFEPTIGMVNDGITRLKKGLSALGVKI